MRHFAVTEMRFARRKTHQCATCRREIDAEDYLRTFEAADGIVSVYIWCRECRVLPGYAA